MLVATGERIGVDGVLKSGSALLDTSLVTGESLPVGAEPGAAVYAGTLNLGRTLTIQTTATGEATLLAECVRLIEAAETRRGRFVVLSDRVARRYAPAVHLCALLTFLWWFFVAGVPVGQALLTASAVLIITCPCALALAVPAVQVIATARLFRGGILLKSPTGLERLARGRHCYFRQDRHFDGIAACTDWQSASGRSSRSSQPGGLQPPSAGPVTGHRSHKPGAPLTLCLNMPEKD